MELKIRRTQSTRLYTDGILLINDMKATSTVEDTLSMLPTGTYAIKLRNGVKRRRVIAVILPKDGTFSPQTLYPLPYFESCGSWISSKKHRSICIGTPIIQGALKEGAEVYNRLFDRIEKAEERGEDITLQIEDNDCIQGEPVGYWTEPSDHGCPPSKRRLEVDSQGNATIYEGNKKIKHISIEEQMANRLKE